MKNSVTFLPCGKRVPTSCLLPYFESRGLWAAQCLRVYTLDFPETTFGAMLQQNNSHVPSGDSLILRTYTAYVCCMGSKSLFAAERCPRSSNCLQITLWHIRQPFPKHPLRHGQGAGEWTRTCSVVDSKKQIIRRHWPALARILTIGRDASRG